MWIINIILNIILILLWKLNSETSFKNGLYYVMTILVQFYLFIYIIIDPTFWQSVNNSRTEEVAWGLGLGSGLGARVFRVWLTVSPICILAHGGCHIQGSRSRRAQSPVPNPQSPVPSPRYPLSLLIKPFWSWLRLQCRAGQLAPLSADKSNLNVECYSNWLPLIHPSYTPAT